MATDYKNFKACFFADPSVGKRVRVLPSDRYNNRLEGAEGVVKTFWSSTSVAVEIFGQQHPTNKHGYFYLAMSELIFIDEDTKNNNKGEEKNMNKIDNYINIAAVQFLHTSNPFLILECANYEPDLKVGDTVVVQTERHGMGLAEVVEIKPSAEGEVLREVVSIVDTTRYDERVEKREKAAELKAKMQERAKQLQDVVLYQTLAKSDPEMAQMLQEFLDIVDPSKEG